MPASANQRLYDLPSLRNRVHVFRDRRNAGGILADLLADYRGTNAVVFAIPAGGVPVGAELAARLGLALEVAVVSKITLPWNPEAGYGAVAFDGSVLLNEELIAALALGAKEIERGTAITREKVARRVQRFQIGRLPDVAGRTVIVVDDGLASGFTLRAAIAALRRREPSALVVAVPTAHRGAAEALAAEVDALYCANVRTGHSFAVADAYEQWCDVSENEAADILAAARSGPEEPS